MDIPTLRTFLMWCTLINAALLLVAWAFIAAAGGFVYRLHCRWFPMSRETFNVAIYAILAAWKLLVIVFNLVPWLVIVIMA